LCGLEAADESLLMDVVGEDALAVDLDDRQPLAVTSLELRVADDVDFFQLERTAGTHAVEHVPSPLAEVAAGRGEERDANGYG
jgi:hypothetical protein